MNVKATIPLDPPRSSNPFVFFWFSSRPHTVPAVIAFVTVLLGSALDTYIPYIYKLITDSVITITPQSPGALWHAVVLYIIVAIISMVLWRISGFSGMYWSTGLRSTANAALSSYVTLHSHRYFTERFAGSLAAKISRAADGIDGFMQALLWQFLRFFVSLISSTILMFVASPLIGGIFLLLIIIVTPLNVYLASKRVPLSIEAQDRELQFGGTILDVLTNITSVHEYSRRKFELSNLSKQLTERRLASIRSWRFSEYVLMINGVLQTTAIASMLIIAITLLLHGKISPGDIILLLTMTSLLEGQLTFIGTQLNNFADNWGQIVSSLSDILIPHEITDPTPVTDLNAQDSTLVFNKMSFGYSGRQVFKDFSLTIPQGQRVGLVGRSGAGKSTLFKILLRHYIPQEGAITIGGIDISSVTKESVRNSIAIVPQDTSLFHRSIAENIEYGKPGSSLEEIKRVAKYAQASEFIEEMPEGYDTSVGERGSKLSGGQRQRIIIARAFLKDAPILLLDEATSALDSEGEAEIQKALNTLMKDRTVLAIAHRLSTLRTMDRILVLDGGAIIEDGTHEELLASGRLYAELWAHQANGFVE